MTDEFTIPPVPQDARMLPEPLSFKLRAIANRMWNAKNGCAILALQFADEAEALEARVRNRRMKP